MADEKTVNMTDVHDTLKAIQDLLKQSIAIQLYIGGATQEEISDNLRVSKTTANMMVKGVKREVKPRTKKEKRKQPRIGEAGQTRSEDESPMTNESST